MVIIIIIHILFVIVYAIIVYTIRARHNACECVYAKPAGYIGETIESPPLLFFESWCSLPEKYRSSITIGYRINPSLSCLLS